MAQGTAYLARFSARARGELARFRAALLDSQEHNHAALIRVAGRMTVEERRLLRDAMTRGRPPREREGSGDRRER